MSVKRKVGLLWKNLLHCQLCFGGHGGGRVLSCAWGQQPWQQRGAVGAAAQPGRTPVQPLAAPVPCGVSFPDLAVPV